MNNIYIQIDGVDYIIPIAVIGTNQITFETYLKKNNDKLYLDIDKMISDKRKEVLEIYEHTVKSVEMNTLAIEGDYLSDAMENRKIYEKDVPNIWLAFNNNQYNKAYKIILNGLKRTLQFYTDFILEDNDRKKKR